jgi:hypothetical protein
MSAWEMVEAERPKIEGCGEELGVRRGTRGGKREMSRLDFEVSRHLEGIRAAAIR